MTNIDSRAYLYHIRNIRPGIISRTLILNQLDKEEWISIPAIGLKLNITANTVRYHLYNMLKERIVEKQEDGSGWRLSSINQTTLPDFAKKKE
jgi:predicted ArsR family transcriptional regulator